MSRAVNVFSRSIVYFRTFNDGFAIPFGNSQSDRNGKFCIGCFQTVLDKFCAKTCAAWHFCEDRTRQILDFGNFKDFSNWKNALVSSALISNWIITSVSDTRTRMWPSLEPWFIFLQPQAISKPVPLQFDMPFQGAFP